MNNSQALSYINAQALTPDQLLCYVSAVSGLQSELVGDYLIHTQNNNAILIGYNLQNANNTDALESVIEQIMQRHTIQNITVLAPVRPKNAPNSAISTEEDAYWFLPLPLTTIKSKVRNMLARAKDKVIITQKSGQGAWTGAHHALMLQHIKNKSMNAAHSQILQSLERYLLTNPQAMLFSAYEKESEQLLACTIADFSSFSTAFYMFAFREEDAEQKVPGVADTVLFALLEEANNRGYSQCNLGLGINDGIRFFKKKWGAKPSLPFIQTSWTKKEDYEEKQEAKGIKKSWLARLLD